MACVASATFLAFARTKVVFDRELTEEEEVLIKIKLKNTLWDGSTCMVTDRQVDASHYTPTTMWSHLSDAEEYISIVNGFNPPPTSVSLEDMSYK